MTFLVELHMCGGSMGEAVPPIEVVHVATKQEAEAIADKVHDHPANEYDDLWADIVEVPSILSEADATKKMLSNYYFEDDEDE